MTYQRGLGILSDLVKKSRKKERLSSRRKLHYYKRVIVLYLEKKIRNHIKEVEKSTKKHLRYLKVQAPQHVAVSRFRKNPCQFHQKKSQDTGRFV